MKEIGLRLHRSNLFAAVWGVALYAAATFLFAIGGVFATIAKIKNLPDLEDVVVITVFGTIVVTGVLLVIDKFKRVYLILSGRPVFALTDVGFEDRSHIRVRRIRYTDVEFFSPPFEMIWHKPDSVKLLEVKLDIEDFVGIYIRHKTRPAKCSLNFGDRVEPSTRDEQAEIMKLFQDKGIKQELVVSEL